MVFCGIYTRNIPDNAASEWYISACRTCILPPMQYDEKQAINAPRDLSNQGKLKVL